MPGLHESPLLPWIVLLPLFGAFLNGVLGRWARPRVVSIVGVGMPTISFVLSLIGVVLLARSGDAGVAHDPYFSWTLYTWIQSGALTIDVSFYLDPLSSVMVLVVTGVGSLIHLYSVGYMKGDPSYHRYFAYLNLFMFSMLMLILGKNLLLLFVGWEGVGLCSYLLIGFWFTDTAKAKAGKKAFIVNRIGDFGFLLGMLILLFYLDGTLDFRDMRQWVASGPAVLDHAPTVTAVCLLLFVGATGKSAQIPLFVWLPDAMAGPTPVSALIHAATMVTAGVYMISRLSFLFVLSPVAMTVIAGVGALTALFAATIGLVQNDIKKVLAYSTVSQLGYMFLAVGVGAFTAGVFHLMTHAFFKALLFLGAGSVIHGLHAYHDEAKAQDLRNMGGLAKKMPITRWTFLIATLAIAGVPLLSGFFSKDEILYKAFTLTNPATVGTIIPMLHKIFWGIGMAAALCTAFYMFRLYFLTFSGESRTDPKVYATVHESPTSMTTVLILLAVGSIAAGYVNVPLLEGLQWLHHWLQPSLFAEAVYEAPHAVGLEIGLMVASVVVAATGIALAWAFYRGPLQGVPAKLATRAAGLYRLVSDKYRIDELYGLTIVRPLQALARFLHRVVDVVFIDGLGVNGSAFGAKLAGRVLRITQTGDVQVYVAFLLVGLAALFWFVW